MEMPDNVYGYYPGGKGKNIQINKKLAQQLQDASPEDRQAALLAVLSTMLHESVHRGDWDYDGLPNSQMFTYYNKDGVLVSNERTEVGEAFEIGVYHDCDFDENLNSSKLGYKGLQDMKKIIDRKKSQEDGKKDLPNIVGQNAANWINSAIASNPNIKLTIY
jgi:hypothetical protein